MATKRAKDIRAGIEGNPEQGGLKFLVDEMEAGRPVLASFIRDGVDRLGKARNALILEGEYAKIYKKFKAAAEKHDFEQGDLEFEGSQYSKKDVGKMSSTIRVEGEAGPKDTNWGGDTKSDTMAYRYLGEKSQPIMGKLFKDLPVVTEMGHQSLSVLIGQIAMLLQRLRTTNKADPRIPHLRGLLVVCRGIDKLSKDTGDLSLEKIVKMEQDVLESDWDVGLEAQAIVHAFTGVKGEVLFTMEPKEINQKLKSTLSKALGKVFQEVVKNNPKKAEALFKNYKILNLKSSPSIAQHIGAQIFNILDPASTGNPKKAKIKPKPAKKKMTLGTARPKRMKSAKLKTIVLTKPKKPKVKSSNVSMNNMLGMINAKLPGQVLDNMRAPGLESRTGRFAQSAKVTEVIQTPQGFPSIGYTYRKDPYQVYETTSGTRFADPDRDPRNVIDLSIREIAATMAIGRLYTRRI